MPTETSTKILVSKYPKYQSLLTMTSQPPVLDVIEISADITNNITIDTPLLAEDAEIPNKSIDSILNNSNSTTAEKYKKERKNEKISINLHSTDNKNDDAIKRTIEHGAEIVFKNDRYTTPVTFEFYPAKRTNQINVFESHKKVFAAMKMMDNTTKIITKKEQSSTTQTPFQRDKHI